MTIAENLTRAKATTEAKRVAKLEDDLTVYGGEYTTLTASAETARAAIMTASSTMETNIQNATDTATLRTYMTQMDS